jgi:hypothetical protein
MTPKNARLLGNIILAVNFAILAVTIVGMAGWMPKIWPTREMMLVVLVMSVVARGLRRRPDRVPPGETAQL